MQPFDSRPKISCPAILLAVLLLLLPSCVPRQFFLNSGRESDVVIMQDGKPAPVDGDDVVHLRRDVFEIRSRWSEVRVCVARSREDIGKIGVGVDARREQGTCFNAKRSYAMGRDADYLVLGDGFNALNAPHGMRKTEWYYLYTVLAFHDATSRKDIPLIQAKGRYHAALWVDRNGDQVLDAGEYMLISLVFE